MMKRTQAGEAHTPYTPAPKEVAAASNQAEVDNRLLELLPHGGHGDPVVIPMKQPLTARFVAANTRFGREPADVMDLIGYPTHPAPGSQPAMRYARIRVK